MSIRLDERKLRAIAAESGDLTGYAIARRTGLSETTLSRALNGKTSPQYQTLVRLARAYKVHVDEIVREYQDAA